jgi:glycosyltransferase involved in cell wall biosynthesis
LEIVVVNYVYDMAYRTGKALLGRYHSLTGWAEALVQAGAAVTVVQRFSSEEMIEQGGVRYLLVKDGLQPQLYAREVPLALHQLVARLQPMVVHLNGLCFPGQTLALRARLPRNTTLVAQHHAEQPPLGSSWRAQLLRMLSCAALRQADGFLFTSEPQAAPWRSIGAISPQQPVWAVPEASTHLVPLERNMAQRASGLQGDPALLWVGHLDANKDPLTVLEGFALALPALPHAHLTMLYAGEQLLAQVRERVERGDLQGRVTLKGRVAHAEMATWYSAADYFVLGSHHEGSGYALIEAMACGVTPVVTAIPSFRALTGNGAVGALWPVANPAGFAAALVSLADKERSAQWRAVLAHFAQHLSWQRVGELALAAYEGVSALRAR